MIDNLVFVEKPKSKKFKDLEKQKFGKLTVIGFAGRFGNIGKFSYWWCKCDCGNIRKITANELKKNKNLSCGCFENVGRTSHNKCYSKEYKSYQYAKTRCTNPNIKYYSFYGGRGIKFLFSSFEEFYAELGDKPEPKNLYSLDRINVNGNYEKGNVRWATKSEQSKNRANFKLIKFKDKEQCLVDWSRELKISCSTLHNRIYNYKWCIECAFTLPINTDINNQITCIHKVSD